jgi:phosphate transport system substrate-binding protein|tara:strand:+ start:732 stop:1634 length:903 start_codon:yes stop_codon:yes gene_type:complete
MSIRYKLSGLIVLSAALIFLPGCGKKISNGDQNTGADKVTEIQNAGSDTMVNVALAWAEEYKKLKPNINVAVAGGGSGTGIAALINGTTDIVNSSRAMKRTEISKSKNTHNQTPKQHIMGLDALAVYVHADNPLEEITIEQIGMIYAEDGNITKWSQLGVTPPGGNDEIIRISRQSNSGTYVYFKETVIPEGKEFKLGTRDLHGSKDVVELIGTTPSAIGYSGMGYATSHVKMLKVAIKKGDPAHGPSLQNAIDKKYPISRPLYMYTVGEPTGDIKSYIDWCLSDAGQKIVVDSGYIPAP